MKRNLLIFGAGGLGREILSLVRFIEEWNVIGFIDDNVKPGTVISGVKVLGASETLAHMQSASLILAIGNPQNKAAIVKKLNRFDIDYPILVHPSAILQEPASIQLGKGVVITAGCILTNGITIGAHTLVNLNSTIGHDTQIGKYCSIMPGVNIAGEVKVGDHVLIGSGSNIINQVKIGDRTVIGMGSVLINDLESDVTAVGVPAKKITAK